MIGTFVITEIWNCCSMIAVLDVYSKYLLSKGFPESVVAAAVSRVGNKVLHLDRLVKDFISFNLMEFRPSVPECGCSICTKSVRIQRDTFEHNNTLFCGSSV